MSRNGKGNVPGRDWSSLFGSVVVALLLVGSGLMGWCALSFAECNNETGALVALALSVFWGAVAAALLTMSFSARRIRAKMRAQVVDQTVQLFLDQLKASNGKELDASRAELVDRIDSLAAKALENGDRRS